LPVLFKNRHFLPVLAIGVNGTDEVTPDDKPVGVGPSSRAVPKGNSLITTKEKK
jgi:hypothetical protein